MKKKVLSNKIGQSVGTTHMEETLIPCKYRMEVMGHRNPISYGKLILTFKSFFLVFVVSFSDHFQFLVFLVSIYVILLFDFLIYFP
jgi:hypothetical protein